MQLYLFLPLAWEMFQEFGLYEIGWSSSPDEEIVHGRGIRATREGDVSMFKLLLYYSF